MTQSGQVTGPSFQMQPNSRKTVRLNDQLSPNTDVSTRVHGSKPVIAERAMYWDNRGAGTDTIGVYSDQWGVKFGFLVLTSSIVWTVVEAVALRTGASRL